MVSLDSSALLGPFLLLIVERVWNDTVCCLTAFYLFFFVAVSHTIFRVEISKDFVYSAIKIIM